jgi:mycothiol system anti-sigma-R factor
MKCEEVLARLWEYLDEELAPEEADDMRAHLGHCGDCYPAYCWDKAFLQLVARLRDSCSAPASLVSAVIVRLRASPRL